MRAQEVLDDPEGLGLAGGQPEARRRYPGDGGQPLAQALELGLPVGILADEAMRLQFAQGAQAFRQRLGRRRFGPAQEHRDDLRAAGFQAAIEGDLHLAPHPIDPGLFRPLGEDALPAGRDQHQDDLGRVQRLFYLLRKDVARFDAPLVIEQRLGIEPQPQPVP